MLEAYCDESHDECNERVLCIAGYLGTAEAWNCFWGAWDRALAEEGVPEFHMADCEGGQQDEGANEEQGKSAFRAHAEETF